MISTTINLGVSDQFDQPEVNNSFNKEKIKLEFSISNTNPNIYYKVEVNPNDNSHQTFKTESKKGNPSQSIHFDKIMCHSYYFEKTQILTIGVIRNNQKTLFQVDLDAIVGSRTGSRLYKYKENEILMIKAEKLEKTDDVIFLKFIFKQMSGKANYFNKNENKIFYKVFDSKNKEIYVSSSITNSGQFELVQIPACIIYPFYTVNFYNKNNQIIYSLRQTKELMEQKMNCSTVPPKNINNILYFFDFSLVTKNYSFIDYIKAGVKIALSIGIDFTNSSGNVAAHSINNLRWNDYARAIQSCGKIVGHYDSDKLFPVYGFGAIINSSQNKTPSMCFNLNMTKDPNIKDINNVLKAYYDCIGYKKVTFSGPALFTPLIKEVVSRINKRDLFEYHILMILTNGEVNDLQQTIDALVEASKLPLSVIIVGIGNNDFSNMKILDGDDIPLVSSTGQTRMRDLVQFVPFSKFENDEKKLSMEVLAEIPRQIVEYYQYNDLNPLHIKNVIDRINALKKIPFSSEISYQPSTALESIPTFQRSNTLQSPPVSSLYEGNIDVNSYPMENNRSNSSKENSYNKTGKCIQYPPNPLAEIFGTANLINFDDIPIDETINK